MKKRLLWLGGFLFLGILSFLFDNQISLFFHGLRNPILSYCLSIFAFETQTMIILFVITSLFLFKENKKQWILPLWITAIITSIASFIIKVIVQRPRPFQEGVVYAVAIAQDLLGNTIQSWNFSFPSYQAALAFCALPILDKEFKKLKYAWLVIAVIISLSRVYFGVHYMSDIIFGGILGYVLGLGVVKIKEKWMNKKK
jgi:undecaprenyl-diphosphatase